MNLSTRFRNTFAIVALIGAFASAAFAQAAGSTLAAQASLVTEFDINGLKVLVKRRPASATVSAGLFYRGGARHLTALNAGIENLMLATSTEASRKFPRDVMRRELASTGSTLGSSVSYDYSVLAMGSTRDAFDRTWDVFADVVVNPSFTPADVELTKQKIISGLASSEDSPDAFLESLVRKTINAQTAYANDPRGTIENVSKFKAEDLRAFHGQVMQTSRLLLVVVGDIDPETIRQRVTATFGKLPKGDYKDAGAPALDFSKATIDITTRELPTNYIEGVFAAPSPKDPDYHAMRVAITALRDRVFEEVRVKRNLSYAPNADISSLAANTGNIYVTAVDANQSIRLMLQEIEELKKNQLNQRELAGISGQFLTTYFLGTETNAAQAGELARFELIGGGWRNYFQSLNRIREVTPAAVQAAAQKYMKNIRFVVIGNPASIDRSVFIPASN
jgi:zinc protease